MKKRILVCVIAIAVLSLLAAACTRSASGSPSDSAKAESTLANPVSTQSQLMKDIIAGTQTAMASSQGEEGADSKDGEPGSGEEGPGDSTPEPKEEPTSKPLPTSTAGPPPEVMLSYNNDLCELSACTTVSNQLICCCVTSNEKDKSFTVQVSNPFFPKNSDIEFMVATEGEYDTSTYLLAGTAKYEPGDQGNYFKATISIPDSLRGTESIYVAIYTEDPAIYAETYFSNN